MKNNIHEYIGDDFPSLHGYEIEVISNNKNKTYSIRFLGESFFHDSINGFDIKWISK